MRKLILFMLTICLGSQFATGQVNEIKSASASTSRISENSYSGGNLAFDILFNVVFGEIIREQQERLQKRDMVPGMISVESMVQVAAQPSSYYLINPRVRANWGLFSTDFRFNYLVEEVADGALHIRTDDWQIVQLNLVTTPDVLFRIGAGIMHENFEGGKVYSEWSSALQVHPRKWKVGANAEYRDAEVRRELSANIEYKLFDQNLLHGYATLGGVYQRYYSTVSVWGAQGGMLLKVY
jgi:hypothetical protein